MTYWLPAAPPPIITATSAKFFTCCASMASSSIGRNAAVVPHHWSFWATWYRRQEWHRIQQLQGFLGLFNFYRRFIPGAAAVIKPLTDTLKGGKSGKTAVKWTAELSASFLVAKSTLSQLSHLEPVLPTPDK
jgi:hypothetical protein